MRVVGTPTVGFPATPADVALHLPLLALPSAAASATLPMLYDAFQQESSVGGALLALLLAKRATLYATALAAVYVCARRSEAAPGGLGARLEQVTTEAVYPAELASSQVAEMKTITSTLDESAESTQAAALPVLFGLLLVSAYAFNVLLAGAPSEPSDGTDALQMQQWLGAAASVLQPLSTASVCGFLTNAEVQASARALVGPPSDADADAEAANADVDAGGRRQASPV